MPRSENVDFNEQGFAAVQRDIRDLFLLAEDGSRDLNQDASPANQTTATDGVSPLGTMSEQDADSVVISGGTLSGVTVSSVPYGFSASIVSGSITAGTGTVTGWATAGGSNKTFDTTGGAFSSNVFTAPTAGYYRVDASGYNDFTPAAATTGATIGIQVNGIDTTLSSNYLSMAATNITRMQGPVSLSGIFLLSASDTVQIAYSSGVNFSIANYRFTVQRL